jgi:hypothetical protein
LFFFLIFLLSTSSLASSSCWRKLGGEKQHFQLFPLQHSGLNRSWFVAEGVGGGGDKIPEKKFSGDTFSVYVEKRGWPAVLSARYLAFNTPPPHPPTHPLPQFSLLF